MSVVTVCLSLGLLGSQLILILNVEPLQIVVLFVYLSPRLLIVDIRPRKNMITMLIYDYLICTTSIS